MKILIAGGGITGLTTALALHKLGLESAVFEKAGELAEIGAGVWLQPNAMRVLEWLGLREEIEKAGHALDRMEITDRQLNPFRQINEEVVQDREGRRTVAIHRGVLQRLLYQAVCQVAEVQLGVTYQDHRQEDDQVEVLFSDRKVHADLLLGADGIHSQVRAKLFPQACLRDSGQLCWRGISDTSLPAELASIGREAWGAGLRFGFSPVEPHHTYWFAVTSDASISPGLDRTAVAAMFGDFHPLVGRIIRQTPQAAIHTAYLHDLKRLPAWHQGSVGLLGDAAHATTPNMGQGACQGMEDAYYIGHCLRRAESIQPALTLFESTRRQKVDYIVNNSWRFGQAAHHPLGQMIMKGIMKLTPASMLQRQMQQLYTVAPLPGELAQ